MSDSYKQVSVIIPTLNVEEFLPLCLESIRKVDYPKQAVEIIVVDNGSTDGTLRIAEKYGAVVVRDRDMNVSGLRNYGVSRAGGEIIAFVDADCIVSRDWLLRASVYFDDADVAAWGSPPLIPEDPTWVQKTWFLVRGQNGKPYDTEWLETMNLFVRKDIFDAAGGFNESLVTCEDVDFSYRVREHGRIVCDSSIEVVHLGEAATIREFIKKEIWRGRGNLEGIFSHGLKLKELPSVLMPVYFGIILPVVLAISFILKGPYMPAAFLFLYLLPSMAVVIKKKLWKAGFTDMGRLLLLLQIYFISRTIAIMIRK